MQENIEIIKHIYKDADMGSLTIQKLIEDLKEKDNKIKKYVEELKKEYDSYIDITKKILEENNTELPKNNIMAKMGARMGINKEVKTDNSDSNIADMLIEGLSMGSLEMEKKIKEYDNDIDKEYMKIAKDFLKFQEKAIDKLKEYL